MRRTLVFSLVVGVVAPLSIGIAVTSGASQDTSCWDEYNNRGTRFFGTLTPKDLALADCTPGAGCFWRYSATGKRNRLYVPLGSSPSTGCDVAVPTTTTSPPTSPTTTETTTPPIGDSRFELLPVGATLPTDAQCATRVRPMTENRPENSQANATRGTQANSTYERVTGDFVGTTDEIIQWTACKWGIDEDWVRAQINNESNWRQSAIGDFSTDGSACSPRFPIGDYPPQWNGDRDHDGECPESVGLGQVRWLYHNSAFVDDNAIDSSAYNLDYTYAVWRECFEGRFGWLNDVEGRGDYAAGDARGCLGVWFSGRWYTDAAVGYMHRFDETLSARPWDQSWFPPALPVSTGVNPTDSATTTSTIVVTLPPTTTTATTTPTTTAVPTTVPVTTAPTTTVAASGDSGDFVETFTGNTGLDRFETGMFHRDDFLVAQTSWTGDHDLNCGGPTTQRTIRRDSPNESFYMCKDHLMTSVGDTSGYSIAWFAPKQTFSAADTNRVSFDVNVTDLGNRQWWEVSIVPVGAPFLATVDWVAGTANIDVYDRGSIVVGKGPFGNDGNIMTDGVSRDPLGWGHVCGSFAADPEGCASKAIRRTFTITDNRDGTITFDYLGERYTYSGAFPDQFEVYFKDHNYTPDKDGVPVGHTWHWDNISIT